MKVCKKVYITPAGEVSSATAAATALEFRFADGTVRRVSQDAFTSPAILEAALWHGLSQKLGDSFASSLTTSDAIEAFDNVLEQLQSGNWNTKAEGGGLRRLAKAVAVVQNISVDAALERFTKMDKETLDKVRKHPAVKAEMAKQAAARAEARVQGVDTEDLDNLLGV